MVVTFIKDLPKGYEEKVKNGEVTINIAQYLSSIYLMIFSLKV
jgi:hypothetical protein